MSENQDTVTLVVTDPSFCTSFVFPGDGEDTLVIDRRGVAVPAKEADSLIEEAARNGVTLSKQEK